MQQFAFIIHPIDAARDVGRKYPIARYLPEELDRVVHQAARPDGRSPMCRASARRRGKRRGAGLSPAR